MEHLFFICVAPMGLASSLITLIKALVGKSRRGDDVTRVTATRDATTGKNTECIVARRVGLAEVGWLGKGGGKTKGVERVV